MLKNRAQAAVKAFGRKSDSHSQALDEKAGVVVADTPAPAPVEVAEIPTEAKVAPSPEPVPVPEPVTPAEATEKPKFAIRALFAPKKKPTLVEAPAQADVEPVQADPFAAQTEAPVTDATEATEADEAHATEDGDKKKGLARIFSLKRKRALESAGASTPESEPKTEAAPAPAAEPESAPVATEAAEDAPTEAQSKRASWKRLRMTRSKSGNVIEEAAGADVKLIRSTSRVIETTADALGAVNAEAAEPEVKKDKKFWAFGRKDEVVAEPKETEPEVAAASAEPAAEVAAVAEQTEAPPTPPKTEIPATPSKTDDAPPTPAKAESPASPPKPTGWKRFMSISKVPEPEVKKDEDKPADAAPAETPATDFAPATETAAETSAAVPETPATEKKNFFVSFGRKSSAKREAASTDAPADEAAPEAQAEEAEPAAATGSEISEKKGGIYRIFSGRRKSTAEVAPAEVVGPAEPVAEPAAEQTAAEAAEPAATQEGKVEELKDTTPAAETPEGPAAGLYRLFSGRRKAPKAEPRTASVQAESVVAAPEATTEAKEECKCSIPWEEAPVAESSRSGGLFRIFSGRRKASADPVAEAPIPQAEVAAPVEPAEPVEPAAEVLQDDAPKEEAPKVEETPRVWKRLLSVRRKTTASPDAGTPVAETVEPAPVADASIPTPLEPAADEPKEEKAGLVGRLRSFVSAPAKDKEVAAEAPAAAAEPETIAETPADKAEKPGVLARVASVLSLTRVKSPTAETPAAESADKPAEPEAAPSAEAAKAPVEEAPAVVAAEPATSAPAAAAPEAAAAPVDTTKA